MVLATQTEDREVKALMAKSVNVDSEGGDGWKR